MWRDHPIFGVGPGRFGLEHPAYRGAREWSLSGVTSHVRTPHDEPLRILAESGLLGALAALFVLWRLVRALGRRALRGEPADRAVALGALAGLGGLLATSLVWFPFRQPATSSGRGARGAALRARDERPAGRLAVVLALVAISASVLLLLFAEADAAGTAARDRLEAGKRELARVLRDEPASAWPPAITAVGGDATRCLQAGRRSFVGPELRYRLLLGAADLVAEARRLEALASRLEDDAWRAPVANAARAFPTDRELQEGLEEAAARAPKHLLLVRLLARTELARGRTAEADSRLRARLVENPDTPLVRRDLADLCLADVAQADGPTSAALYETAIDLLEAELERYPRGVEGDATWEKLARATGRQGRLTDALEVVREWNRRAGSSDLRWSVGGEIALRFGESPESLGRFLAAEAPGYAPPEVASAVAALDGLEPAEAHRRLLAMLGRHPDDPAVLAALERVIADLSAASPDPEVRRRYRDDRSRAIARAKVLYAAEQLRDGEIRLARISLRAALRTWPAQGDAHVLGALLALRDGDETGAIEILLEWRRQGFSRPSALAVFPDLAPLLSHPKLASWIENEG
ncbi:MAG: hypothetical protein R3F20_12515 [Planctomycetota bacterium]